MLLIISFLLTLTAGTIPDEDWQDQIVEWHNAARKRLRDCQQEGINGLLPPPAAGYPMLQWSETLAESADSFASSCKMAKNGKCWHYDPNPYGECASCNSFLPRKMTVEESQKMIVNRMIDQEVSRWKYGAYNGRTDDDARGFGGEGNCFAGGVWKNEGGGNCGHYTQIIWDKTTHVGCAYEDCNDASYAKKMTHLVCRYEPAGNLLTRVKTLPYQIGGACDSFDNPVGNCLEISGFTNVNTIHEKKLRDLNGQWTKTSFGWKKGNLELRWDDGKSAWLVDELMWAWGYCSFANLADCDNNWWFIRKSGPWARFANGVTFNACGALVSTDFPCYEKHAKTLNFRLNASHAGLEFERVDVAGCHNDAAQWFASSDKYDENATEYTLTAGNATLDGWHWLIHDTTDPYPRYVCNSTELYGCGRGTWHEVVMLDSVANASYIESAAVNESELAPVIEAAVEHVLLNEARLVPDLSASSDGNSALATGVVLAVVVAVLFLVVVTVAGYVVCKRARQRAVVMDQMEAIPDDEHAHVADTHTGMENY